MDDDLEQRTATIGQVTPHVEIKVVGRDGKWWSANSTLAAARPRGCWDAPERIAEAIDDEGWMHTGDLAVMREDGYCLIVGRIKGIVIRGGENIYLRKT